MISLIVNEKCGIDHTIIYNIRYLKIWDSEITKIGQNT